MLKMEPNVNFPKYAECQFLKTQVASETFVYAFNSSEDPYSQTDET